MAYPSVSVLPMAPARVGDPANFFSELNLFMAGFTDFRSESNMFSGYVNALTFNDYDWGIIGDINPEVPTVNLFGPMPENGISGFEFATRADATLSAVQFLSTQINATGAFVDALDALTPSIRLDDDSPNIGILSEPPLRGQALALQESLSVSFYASCASYAVSLKSTVDYYANVMIGNDDYGLVNEGADIIIDFGVL